MGFRKKLSSLLISIIVANSWVGISSSIAGPSMASIGSSIVSSIDSSEDISEEIEINSIQQRLDIELLSLELLNQQYPTKAQTKFWAQVEEDLAKVKSNADKLLKLDDKRLKRKIRGFVNANKGRDASLNTKRFKKNISEFRKVLTYYSSDQFRKDMISKIDSNIKKTGSFDAYLKLLKKIKVRFIFCIIGKSLLLAVGIGLAVTGIGNAVFIALLADGFGATIGSYFAVGAYAVVGGALGAAVGSTTAFFGCRRPRPYF